MELIHQLALGLVTPHKRPYKHQVVINDVAFSIFGRGAAEYNSACVNTLAALVTVTTPRLPEKSGGRLF